MPARRRVRHERPHALHDLGDVEQPLHAGEVDAPLVDQVLDEAQAVDLDPRVDADAADRAGGLDEPQALVLAERLRVHAQLPRRHADEEQLLVLSHILAKHAMDRI